MKVHVLNLYFYTTSKKQGEGGEKKKPSMCLGGVGGFYFKKKTVCKLEHSRLVSEHFFWTSTVAKECEHN